MKKVISLILALVMCLSLCACGGGNDTPRKSNRLEDGYGHNEFDAVVVAEKVVKSKLKSPSTAEFCKHREYTITCSGDTWTIKGYVDAQNSFGATLRNNFTVKITFTSSTKYTIDLCSIK
jgi:hypothetical protein